ncbi:MAG: ABC transporter permease, partial [Phycisphaerales bacterium]
VVPFSPNQSESAMFNRPPGSTPMDAMWDRLEQWQRLGDGQSARYTDEQLAEIPVTDEAFEELDAISGSIEPLVSEPIDDFLGALQQRFDAGDIANMLALREAITEHPAPLHVIGTDTLGQDVLSQMFHACRLAISIGFVSTGIAVVLGVTIGSLMGYFGGWVDLLLYRVVEIFMAIPVLFLLIVAAGLLPRNTYVMMAIIGCFTWTGAARFIRAEFMKLRETDYVQAAQAMGLPLWSILFKHMLPNGVTPVLVESSFLIAAAILIEAILSFLGLGPSGQASWGNLLRNASGETGDFIWWLAIFPGGAIFLTTLAYNLIGEALRDAIDPKLKKARV